MISITLQRCFNQHERVKLWHNDLSIEAINKMITQHMYVTSF